jgi:hypothetical protein
MNSNKVLVVITILTMFGTVALTTMPSLYAKELPQGAKETGNKNNDCGGSNEVKEGLSLFGSDTGRLTGQFNSENNDRDDPSIHEQWPLNADDCRNNE